MKKAITYLFYVLGLLLLVYYGVSYQQELRIIAGRDFNPLPPMLLSFIYSVMVGIYIALPRFINSLKKQGRFYVNWSKILIIGIPAFLIGVSGILNYYFVSLPFSSLISWIYVKYNEMGTTLIGVACGYTLLSSITKIEVADTVPFVKLPIAKVFVLLIFVSSILYISLSGFIHPLKLVDVQADIVKNDHESGYLVNDGKDTVFFIRTEINYHFKFKNMPIRFINKPENDSKIRIEPKDELQQLAEDIFIKPGGLGYSCNGNNTEITLTYTLGSIDPEGNHPNITPPTPEVLEEIKDSLYNSELVIEISDKDIKRLNLLDYKKN